MLNLLRMDLRRFMRNRLMPVLLVVYVGFHLLGIFMQKQYPVTVNGLALGDMTEAQFLPYILAGTPSWPLIYLTVFTVFFYMSEYNAGFYKNYIAMRRARIYSVISKMAVQACFTLVLLLTVLLTDLLGRYLFFGSTAFGSPLVVLQVLLVKGLLHWAFTIVVLLLSIVFKSVLTAVVAGMVLSFNLLGMALGALESLTGLPAVSSYLLVNQIAGGGGFGMGGPALREVLVGIGFALLFGLAAVRVKMKEDLR